MQRHDKDKKCFAKRRSIMGYCRTNFGDFLMKINIDNVQILVYVGRNCISVRSSETVHAPRKSHKSDKKRQKATQQKTINGRNGYKKSQTFRSDPTLRRLFQKAPQLLADWQHTRPSVPTKVNKKPLLDRRGLAWLSI